MPSRLHCSRFIYLDFCVEEREDPSAPGNSDYREIPRRNTAFLSFILIPNMAEEKKKTVRYLDSKQQHR
jgi:hypothetical protein